MYINVEGPAGPSVAASVVARGGSELIRVPTHAPYQMELSVIRSSRSGVKVRLTRIRPDGSTRVLPADMAVRLACMERASAMQEMEQMVVVKQQGG